MPVVFFVHLAATLDNWDPRLIDSIAAKNRTSSPLTTRGSARPPGRYPTASRRWPTTQYAFIKALGLDKIDLSLFPSVASSPRPSSVKHPELVRKLVLTGTGPKGGKDIDKVAGITLLGHAASDPLTRSDAKEFLFFNRNATGKAAAKAFVKRLEERTVDRDAPIKVKAFPGRS